MSVRRICIVTKNTQGTLAITVGGSPSNRKSVVINAQELLRFINDVGSNRSITINDVRNEIEATK